MADFGSILLAAVMASLALAFWRWVGVKFNDRRKRKFKEANPRGLVRVSGGEGHSALVRVQYGLSRVDEPLDDDWKIIGADSEAELEEEINAWVEQSRARRGV